MEIEKKTNELKNMNMGRLIALFDRHITQAGVARYLGVTRSRVGQLLKENGLKMVKKITVDK